MATAARHNSRHASCKGSRTVNSVGRDGAATGAALLAQEAMRSRGLLPDVQYGHVDGVIDLTWGHPDPSAFATEDIAAAMDDLLVRSGWQALSYGAPAGAAMVRTAVADHLALVDAPVSPRSVLMTAGSSGGLDLVLSLLTTPGDVVFVEQPTYFLALRIFADHGIRVVGLRSDDEGPLPSDLRERAAAVTREGHRALLYLIPTYANPTGRCLPEVRAVALLEAAAACGVRVIEDDVYRDTALSPPPSLFSIDPANVIRLGSFSKSLAPGLRVGFLTAASDLVDTLAGCGLLDSGGGTNHLAAMLVGELVRSGRFGEIAAASHRRLADRRAALVDALDTGMFAFDPPGGGFFVWLRLPDGVEAARFVEAARVAGVLVSNGNSFFAGEPPAAYVRLSFSMLHESLLRDGAVQLAAVARGCVTG
jgi:2-aminoadipate transaminase